MSEQLKPNKASFEKRYLDDSGVELGVRFCGESVEIEAGESVYFKMEDIDFVIEALEQIKAWNTRTSNDKEKQND